MNKWTKKSIEIGNNNYYLDKIYSNIFNFESSSRRALPKSWIKIEQYYNSKNSLLLFQELLKNKIFPFEDTAIGYFRIHSKINNDWYNSNPIQRDRILSKIYSMDLNELKIALTRPKKGNQKIGPMFKDWVANNDFCIKKININDFSENIKDCILIGSDKQLKDFASEKLNYNHKKGLDFIARKNNKYIVGEQKLITDQGGNQDKSIADIERLLSTNLINCTKIGILDGVVYLKNNGNLYKTLTNSNKSQIMITALLLDSFLNEFE